MKIEILREALLRAVGVALSAGKKNGVRHSYQCVHLVTTEFGLAVSGTDGDVFVRRTMATSGTGETLNALVPAETLNGILCACDSESVTLSGAAESLSVVSGKSNFELRMCTETFPPAPERPEQIVATVKAEELDALMRNTLYAVATESGRYAINGLHLEAVNNTLAAIGTDGRRLAHSAVRLSCTEKVSATIPLKAARLVRKLCAESEMVSIYVSGRFAWFAFDSQTELSTIVIEGAFPKTKSIVDTKTPVQIKFSTEVLVGALKRAEKLCSPETRAVDVEISGEACVLSSKGDVGLAYILIPCASTAECVVTVSVNPQYMLEALSTVEAAEVVVGISENGGPVVVRDGMRTHVIMPINQKG